MSRLLHTGQVIVDLVMALDTLPATGGDVLAKCIAKVWIIDRGLAVRAKVGDIVAQCCQPGGKLGLERESGMV